MDFGSDRALPNKHFKRFHHAKRHPHRTLANGRVHQKACGPRFIPEVASSRIWLINPVCRNATRARPPATRHILVDVIAS
jgi:hypothetical protein